MTGKQKKMLYRILAAGVLFLAVALIHLEGWPRLALYLIPYGIIGWDVLLRAARNIRNGQVFDENFLMAVATIGAFGCGELPEAVAVMLFYQVGELFQSVAVSRSRSSIAALMDIRPDYANLLQEGQLVQVDPEEVAVDQIIVVKAGERVPLDGVVLEGASSLDTAALTGESIPRDVRSGDAVISGCVNLTGVLQVRVTRPFGESTVSKILDLVENASSKKARAERFITRFARYYTPAVVLAALALAVLPPLLGMGAWGMWVQRALNFLVVSCPCALVISIPLSFFGGIGGASKQGILIKGGNYLETLATTGIVVFDKTGTLTRGMFSVAQICPAQGVEERELLELAALAEQFSTHPISRSLKEACVPAPDPARVTDAQELAGHGIQAVVDGQTVLAGNLSLMERFHIPAHPLDVPGTVVYVAAQGRYLGAIVIADQVKEGAAAAIASLKAAGVRKTVMLTGDTRRTGEAVAAQLRLDAVHTQLLPGDKVEKLECLLAEKRPGEGLVFVGDGINDAPVLSRADVGVAMGGLGSDAAIEAADIVLMDDDLSKLAAAIHIAKKTLWIVKENIVFALAVKLLVLVLSAMGDVSLWWAVFADVGVAVLAILNATRMLRVK